MATRLIALKDGTLIQVEVPEDQSVQIAGSLAQTVDASLDKIKPIVVKICEPIISAWEEIDKDMYIDAAEVELGLSFECEGNLYIAKSKANANLAITFKLKPVKQHPTGSSAQGPK